MYCASYRQSVVVVIDPHCCPYANREPLLLSKESRSSAWPTVYRVTNKMFLERADNIVRTQKQRTKYMNHDSWLHPFGGALPSSAGDSKPRLG